jgi:ribosome-associated heat shock protein Hsp15
MTDDRQLAAVVRLDVWLDLACLFRTRSEAQKACKGGKVDVNGQRAKSNRVVRVGDILELKRSYGRTQRLVVKAITRRHVTKAEARQLYEDLTPAPTAEEIAMRRIERMYRAAMTPTRTPDKRARRALRELKERQR